MLEKPIKRSKLRLAMGKFYYANQRKMMWFKNRRLFAKTFQKEELPYCYFTHRTILRRPLQDVEMWMQENKIINLNIASQRVSTILLRPNEIFSYWKLIGKPSRQKGYLEGMILHQGVLKAGIGGGLCQLSNLIFWMTLHTPLTIIERHRHGFDVFPDANRTQPFGSGATCFYPHGDLMIQNNTQEPYQLIITMDDEYLIGEWRVPSKPQFIYKIVERNHEMRAQYWGGYSRHNELFQQKYDLNHNLIEEKLVVKNAAIMMYSPFIEEKQE